MSSYYLKVPKDYSLKKTLESGQCFRFQETEQGQYSVKDGDKAILVRQSVCEGNTALEISSISGDGLTCAEIDYWTSYFGDFKDSHGIESIMLADPFLFKVYEVSKGVYLLNQDPWQILVSFIISQRRSIPSIKSSLHKICLEAGEIDWERRFTRFPSPEALASANLSGCGLGYREKYISSVSQRVASGFNLDSLKSIHCDAKTAYEDLTSLYGVGKKVANCVMLFGLGYRNIFPVDVWIERALKIWGKTEQEVLDQYGNMSGLIQQHIFYAMTQTKGKL